MAKRNIRKTDPEITNTPENPDGRAAAPKTTRSRRKSDPSAPVPEALAATKTSPISAEAAVEPALSPDNTAVTQPQAAAPAFTTVAEVAGIELSHDKIAERAYHLYLERGRQPGDPFADWLTAERELRERYVGA
jgi:hypothetical protein